MVSQDNRAQRVLLISHDVIGKLMAGPGIRYFQLAQVLSHSVDVSLAIPSDSPPDVPKAEFSIVRYTRQDWASIAPHIQRATIIIAPSDIASDFPQIAQSSAYIVIDGYDPLLAEWLALSHDVAADQLHPHWIHRMTQLQQQYLIGDFFICASERQRDWWLGLLEANGRINSFTYDADPSLRGLVDTVPFGLNGTLTQHTRQTMKGVWPGINPSDRVILWGGGLWSWLDPLTAIRAMAHVHAQRPDVKLVFPGTRHPNTVVLGDMPTQTASAIKLAQELGLYNQTVFFGDWVPYADWPNVLLESDLALSLHHDTLETRLAFRARVIDCIWAGLPIIATRGDATSELIVRYGLGECVEYGDVNSVAEALLRLLDIPRVSLHERFEVARRALTWERMAQPLINFCQHPRHAADRLTSGQVVGNPFYLQQINALSQQLSAFQDLIRRIEQGRFMRFMRWLRQFNSWAKAPQ